MKTLFLAILAIVCLGAAASPTTRPTNHVHRITGLFSPDREQDLHAALEKIPGIRLVSLDLDHAEATLSYVGLGFANPTPSWGVMLKDAAGISAMTDAPWLMAPAVVIVLTMVAIQLVIRGSETRARPPQNLAARGSL